MTKKEFLCVLLPELERLKTEKHILDLIEEGRYDEAEEVINAIDYSFMDSYMDHVNEGKEDAIDIANIPSEHMKSYVLFLWGSGHDETEVMKCWEDLQNVLYVIGSTSPIWKVTAEKMDYNCLTDIRNLVELFTPDD